MKTYLTSLILIVGLCGSTRLQAQAQEVQQLVLNYAKLKQLEEILDNMYKGYKILMKGYNTIKDISEGNFKLHQVFLDGLYAVNPAVRDYKRIPYIIQYQQFILKEGRKAFDRFRTDPNLTVREVKHLEKVYAHILRQSLRHLDELITIVTAAKLRMNDEERLRAVDRIYQEMEEKVIFLKMFNASTQVLIMQRAKQKFESNRSRQLYLSKP